MNPHVIIILEPLPGRYYRASYNGELIVARSREPEFDACRVLLARGITGHAETWRTGAAHPAMRLDIERAAQLTVVETPSIGPRLATWRPFRGIGDEAASQRRRGAVQADLEGGALPTLGREANGRRTRAGISNKCDPPTCRVSSVEW